MKMPGYNLKAPVGGAMKRLLFPIVLVFGVSPARASVFFQTSQVVVEQTAMKTFPLPVEQMRGWTVRGSASVKAEQVSPKPNPWNGVKFMLVIETPEGKTHPQAPLDAGTYDWKRAGFSVRIPANAVAVTLCLGLENVTGKVCFDDVNISGHKPPSARKPAPVTGPMFTGRAVPRLRGAMIGPRIDEDGLRTLGRDWNANLVRWQLIRHRRTSTADDYDQWLEAELQRLDAGLPLCEKYGLMVAVDLHSPPGGKPTISGYFGSDDRLFTDRKMQDKFVEIWRQIAKRYKDSKAVWGYDLANEPVEEFVEDGCDDWHGLAERAAKAIREVDPERAIICEAPPWGSPNSLAEFEPINVSNVVYSVHMYVPGEFTHQGVHRIDSEPVRYPGLINEKMWDKAALEKVLQPVVDFQKNYNVHIYIGEFSAIRWAPGDSAYRYLKDCIDLFESHGWDWSYHAFREWDGWSVEHGPGRNDRERSPAPTDREKLLRSWFESNQKP